jgi:hypothetical protein
MPTNKKKTISVRKGNLAHLTQIAMLCFGFFMSEKGKKHEILLLSNIIYFFNTKNRNFKF